MSHEIESKAEQLYEIYCAAVGGVAFNGETLPKWPEFAADPKKEKQANGWREAANSVLSPKWSPEQTEYAAGSELAREGKPLPDLASAAARQGYSEWVRNQGGNTSG